MIGLDRKGCERVPAGVHSLVQVGDLLAATLLNVTLAAILGQVGLLLCGVAIGLLAGGVGRCRARTSRDPPDSSPTLLPVRHAVGVPPH